MKTLVNITAEKKDLVKAGNAVNTFKDFTEQPIKITGIVIFEKNDEHGELKTVSALKLANGEFITSISPTAINSLYAIVESYDADEIKAGLDIIIKTKKSNSGRDFLYIDLV